MAGPLSGFVRILDLSERSPAAAIAGMVLADLGAEVIRVEPEGGDPLRALAGSRVWLRGQKSVTVGPVEVQNGQWESLCNSADVIIDTAQPWRQKPSELFNLHANGQNSHPARGLGTPSSQRSSGQALSLRRAGKEQIIAVLTAYPRMVDELATADSGTSYPVYGELIEAQYGMQHFQAGVREGGPTFLGWPHAIYGAAWLLQIGILGALLERERIGVGQTITTSLLDGIAILSNARWLGGENLGPPLLTSSRISTRHNNLRIVVSLFECSDGEWIQVHTGPRGAFDRMLKVAGRDDLVIENAGLHVFGIPMEPAAAEDLWSHLDLTFKSKPAQYWCDTMARADVCCMPALKPGDALWLNQMEANGLVDILPDGQRQLGKLAKYRRTPIEVRREIPAPGEHNAMLLANGSRTNGSVGNGGDITNLDLTRSHSSSPPARPSQSTEPALRRATEPRPGGQPAEALSVVEGDEWGNGEGSDRIDSVASNKRIGPLDGMLVLDFGAYMAGPFANRLFADLGARVIKVEEYGGDPMRGPQLSIFLGVQRGKESIAVDLKSEAGRRIIHELVKRADVVHNNMRLGAMERLGMGWEQLGMLNPRLVYCHSSGYGNSGEWSRLPTFEPLHSAITGMLSRTGGKGNPPEHYLTHMDYGCGLTSTVMVLAALVERECSGLGQYLEVPQTGAGLLAMSDVHGHRERKSETFPLDHDQRGHAPTNALYRTFDGWIVIACYSQHEWESVRRALAIDASWPSFAEARNQRFGQSDTAQLVQAALINCSTAAATRRLRAEDVPCMVPAPFAPAEVIVEPTLRSRGVIVAEQHHDAGEIFEVGHTIRFGNANSWNLRPAPVTGQHSIKILRELGISEAEIKKLIDSKVVNAEIAPQATAAAAALR
jgi:crotonobetainyl-CoA:carnitine CoA-transferase CaiB-like acyl-CoA transferase